MVNNNLIIIFKITCEFVWPIKIYQLYDEALSFFKKISFEKKWQPDQMIQSQNCKMSNLKNE